MSGLVRCFLRLYAAIRGKIGDLTFATGGIRVCDLGKVISEVKRVTKKWFIVTFTSEKFKCKLHYRLGLVHLRFSFNSQFPKFLNFGHLRLPKWGSQNWNYFE